MEEIDLESMNAVFDQAYSGFHQSIIELEKENKYDLKPALSFIVGYVSGVLNIKPKDLPKTLELLKGVIQLKSNQIYHLSQETENLEV